MSKVKQALSQLLLYKSALIGSIIILFLVGVSIYTIITLPYEEATRLWRAGEQYWLDNPRNALPSWMNIFSQKRLPETIVLTTEKAQVGVSKAIVPTEKFSIIKIKFSFNYEYDDFPSEINLFFKAKFNESSPYLTIYWVKPNGDQINLKTLLVSREDRYYVSGDEDVAKDLRRYISKKINVTIEYETPVTILLFAQEDASILNPDTVKVMKGTYELLIDGIAFESNADLNAKLVVYGKVYGLAGTDHYRRDLSIALVWG
ncbi:MAG: ABC transporter permease, partial [Candidatus Bathyarchaeia archaeon]